MTDVSVAAVADRFWDRQRVVELLRDVVWPAHAMYLDELHAYRLHAAETLGFDSLPGGEAL